MLQILQWKIQLLQIRDSGNNAGAKTTLFLEESLSQRSTEAGKVCREKDRGKLDMDNDDNVGSENAETDFEEEP